MKFIKLESRGGNYLVVASNVAWLRTAENGQTSVGIVGGQPLLVAGSVEEVAQTILTGLAGFEADALAPPRPAPGAAPAPPRAATARSASLWERPAAATAKSPKIKSSLQRMMGKLE